MEYFCGSKEDYLVYLSRKGEGKAPYIDPDGTYIASDSEFYKKLIDFLMAADDTWSYRLKSEYVAGNLQPAGIWVEEKDNSKPFMYLRSDQFGFSAPQNKGTWNEKYPYASLLHFGGKEKENFVADCVWDTRTLGGSFLWPLACAGNRWKSMYNLFRGVRGYIEDRVDLTLYEIKCFYDVLEENQDSTDQMICGQLTSEGHILLRYIDNIEICKWLKHFQSFKGYIDHFCFQPFVDEQYQIIDIMKAELTLDKEEYGFTTGSPILNSDTVKQYREQKEERIKSIKNPEKLRQILLNVRAMTRRRTNEMEKRILNSD